MKKILFTMLLFSPLMICENNVFAQATYWQFNAGYDTKMSTQNILFNDEYFINVKGYENSYTVEQIDVSFGKGINGGLAFGYMFSDHFGVELGLSYLFGGKTKSTSEYHYDNESGIEELTIHANMFRILPTLVVGAGNWNGINPYAKLGLACGMGSIKLEYYGNEDGDIESIKADFNGGLAIGMSGAFGAGVHISDNLALLCEISMVNMSYAPAKGILTEAVYNGQDELHQMTTSEKEFDFVEQYTHSFSNPPPDSQPTEMLKQKYPFGSVGLKIGLSISL